MYAQVHNAIAKLNSKLAPFFSSVVASHYIALSPYNVTSQDSTVTRQLKSWLLVKYTNHMISNHILRSSNLQLASQVAMHRVL